MPDHCSDQFWYPSGSVLCCVHSEKFQQIYIELTSYSAFPLSISTCHPVHLTGAQNLGAPKIIRKSSQIFQICNFSILESQDLGPFPILRHAPQTERERIYQCTNVPPPVFAALGGFWLAPHGFSIPFSGVLVIWKSFWCFNPKKR
jgi:hypothetical protein